MGKKYHMVEIGELSNSKKVRIWNVTEHADGIFSTRTILNGQTDYYSLITDKQRLMELGMHMYHFKPTKEVRYYERCEAFEATEIVLPKLHGHAFENIVEVVDVEKNLFIVDCKLPLERVINTKLGIDKYEPKYNEILNYNAIKWVNDDKHTLIELNNGGAYFIKQKNC